jgi:membrane-bound lytic murein transglycosylase D
MNPTMHTALESRMTPWLLLTATLAVTGAFILPAVLEQPPQRPELQALSAKIHARGQDYGKGLALIVAGDGVMGRNLVESATDRMSIVAEECTRTEGCDATFFIDALRDVFAEQRLAIVDARRRPEPVPDPVPSDPPLLEDEEVPPAPELPEMSRAVALLRGIDMRELITLNLPVKSALNDWLTWNRPQLSEAYENYLFLREDTAPIYEKANLPEALLFAIMAQETGGKVHAYSKAGAAGPLQFMPQTALRYGLVRVGGFDMRLDPVAAARASAEYLNDQLGRFNNDLEKALAAYNVGETRLGTLHRRLEGASFWTKELYYSVPRETRDYVPAVMAAAWIFLHPEEYGFAFPDLEVGITDIVLREETSIGELTICLGQTGSRTGWFRTLRNLNPRLKGNQRIAGGESVRMPSQLVPTYVEQCAEEARLRTLARELHDAAYEKKWEVIEYTVTEGDTLADIAGRFGCPSVNRLARVNRLKAPGFEIHAGQRLTIPGCG